MNKKMPPRPLTGVALIVLVALFGLVPGLEAAEPLGGCVPLVEVCDGIDNDCDLDVDEGGDALCDDLDSCTNDTCTGASGCASSPVDCDDADACNGEETCDLVLGCLPGVPPSPVPVQICNTGPIGIPDSGAATPYPAEISVLGWGSVLCSVTVSLDGVSHAYPDDLDVLLVGPGGQDAIIMSDVGGGIAVTGVDLTLDDGAASSLPDDGPLASGTFKPTDFGAGDPFPGPAPEPSGGSALSVFAGTDPRGTWRLFVLDDGSADAGSIASGWCLNLATLCAVDPDCDDGNVCTEDACVAGACGHTPNTSPCSDGDPCTAPDTCNDGTCVGGPNPCDDGNVCTLDACDGGCTYSPVDCEDGNDCTDDSCDSATGCVSTPDDTNACTDENVCTTDACSGGQCMGSEIPCEDDGEPCTDAVCDPVTGCAHVSNDVDGDGVCPFDNCPDTPNEDQSNTDGDSYGDACDVCPLDPLDDSDGDGLCAEVDDCPIVYDPEQADADEDGVGDACDSCPGDPLNDADGDQLCGGADNCPNVPNPDQADSDEDGVGDACESLRVNFAPAEPDGAFLFLHDDGSPFDPARRFGWDLGVQTRFRDSGAPFELDTFAFSNPERHWSAEVANGEYDVHVLCGDPAYAQGPQRVRANGVPAIEDVETSPGEYTEATVRVPVRNGRLALSIGGTAGNTTINYVEATRVGQGPSYLRSFNFQPSGATTPEGFEADTGASYDEELGHGWNDELPALERDAAVAQVLDTFVFSEEPASWDVELPGEGYYDVWLSAGDPDPASHGIQRIVVEGIPVVLSEPTERGRFIELRTGALVDDGYLTIEIGGGGGVTSLSYIVIASADEDADGDGITNVDDLCPFDADPDQDDSDEDDYGDSCDPDRDGDGIENFPDNCPDTSNPDLADSDKDRIGDACDVCPLDPFDDHDQDSVCGLSDLCPNIADPEQVDSDGDGLGDACDQLRANFQPSTSPVPVGFRKDDGSTFSPFLRYGWDLLVPTRDRLTSAPPELDTFAFSAAERAWTAEVPNGDYDVRVVVGDASFSQGPQHVTVQGIQPLEDVITARNGFVEGTARVAVRNGRLELRIGGAGGFTTINYVEATDATDGATGFRSFSFQPAGSVVPYGFTADDGSPYDAGRGYGWSANVPTRERGRPLPQVLDTFAFSRPLRTWEVSLPNGLYQVWLSVGDASHLQGPQRVVVEGTIVVNDETTDRGRFLERETIADVQDGALTVAIGGADGNTCLDYLVLLPVGEGGGPEKTGAARRGD